MGTSLSAAFLSDLERERTQSCVALSWQVLVRDGRHSPYDRVIYLKNRDYVIEKIRLPERKVGLIGECPFLEVLI